MGARVFVFPKTEGAGVASAVSSVIRLEPVVRERMADLETPVSAFAKLRRLGGAFLLESAVLATPMGITEIAIGEGDPEPPEDEGLVATIDVDDELVAFCPERDRGEFGS